MILRSRATWTATCGTAGSPLSGGECERVLAALLSALERKAADCAASILLRILSRRGVLDR